MTDHEPTTGDRLRSAADHLDDARIDLDQASDDAPDDAVERRVDEMDGIANDLIDTMRELAIVSDVREDDE